MCVKQPMGHFGGESEPELDERPTPHISQQAQFPNVHDRAHQRHAGSGQGSTEEEINLN